MISSFKDFIFTYFSIAVIISLLTAKVISSFFENVFNGIFYYLTPDDFFYNLNKLYNHKKEKLNNKTVYEKDDKKVQFGIYYGSFLRDFIIWFLLVLNFFIMIKLFNKYFKK